MHDKYRPAVLNHFLPASVAAILSLPAGALPTLAHDAKSGWSYPTSCCSDYDCREVSASLISERSDGYRVEATGETMSFSDPRVRTSPDGVFHWCSVGGRDDGRTICLFVPPQSF